MKFFKIIIFITSIFFVLYAVNKIISYYEYPTLKIQSNHSKKAIVVGATSGMGREVTKTLAQKGYEVGLVGRRGNLLNSLQKQIATKTYIKQIDVSQTEKAKKQLEELIKEMGGLDLMFISVTAQGDIGCTIPTSKMSFQEVKRIMDVDLYGFWVAAHVATKYFEKQKHGHLVGVSSISKIKGSPISPEYSAAKAFVSKYLDGIRNRMIKNNLPIFVTEIIPGFVDVERQKYSELKGAFWVATTKEAAKQICDAIESKEEKVYVTKRWRLIAWFLQIIPDWFYRKI